MVNLVSFEEEKEEGASGTIECRLSVPAEDRPYPSLLRFVEEARSIGLTDPMQQAEYIRLRSEQSSPRREEEAVRDVPQPHQVAVSSATANTQPPKDKLVQAQGNIPKNEPHGKSGPIRPTPPVKRELPWRKPQQPRLGYHSVPSKPKVKHHRADRNWNWRPAPHCQKRTPHPRGYAKIPHARSWSSWRRHHPSRDENWRRASTPPASSCMMPSYRFHGPHWNMRSSRGHRRTCLSSKNNSSKEMRESLQHPSCGACHAHRYQRY